MIDWELIEDSAPYLLGAGGMLTVVLWAKLIRVLCKKRKVEEVKTEKVDFKVITPPKAPVSNPVVTVNPLPSAPEQEEPAPAYTNYGNSVAV